MKSIVLAGGVGSRLWPLSREHYPKQFINFFGDKSLFQSTIDRVLKISKPEDIFVSTNEKYEFLIKNQLEDIGTRIPDKNIIKEPVGRGTLPAALLSVKTGGKGVYGMFPSDHTLDGNAEFLEAIQNAVQLADKSIVTFGVVPNCPHTGYGYIKPGSRAGKGFRVEKFFEKPDEVRAKKYLSQGFLWNSGIFVFDSSVLLSETRRHSPDSMPAYDVGEKAFDSLPHQSIDRGIMELTSNSAVIPLKAEWNDLGSFSSFFEIMKKGNGSIVTNSEVLSHGAGNSLVFTENGKKKLVTLVDVEDLVIVDAPDAMLVAPMRSAQKVGDIVKYLKKNDDPRASTHQSTHRPWGFYVDLEASGRYRLKRIVVYSGKRLSLQKHYNRSEHWVVVRGTAKATINESEQVLRAGESVFIPVGSHHRLENPGKIPLELIEVQIGDYTGEDDIVRVQDDFGRN